MATNSLGQFIVEESGSSIVSIKVTEQYISLDQYNRFLLDNKEFTELTPTIDKDALINNLTNQINTLNNTVNTLNNTVNNLNINARGGFLVSVATPQYAWPVVQSNAITYNGQKVWESIGFDDDSTPPNFNSEQSNGKKFWSIPDKAGTIYKDANSQRYYDVKASVRYRFKFIGLNDIDNVKDLYTKLQFWVVLNSGEKSASVGDGVTKRLTLSKQSYKPGDYTEEFTINLDDKNNDWGGGTDTVYLPVKFEFWKSDRSWVTDQFIMEILPGSTMSLLPQ
jgi:hypothetical protein